MTLAFVLVWATLRCWPVMVLRPLQHPVAPVADYRPRAGDGVR